VELYQQLKKQENNLLIKMIHIYLCLHSWLYGY